MNIFKWSLYKNLIAVSLLLFSVVLTPLSAVQAAANNGTLQIHEYGTPSGTESNDPKVCVFNLEGFGFDPNDSGYLKFETQGGSSPVGTNAGPFNFGPTDANGFAATTYFNGLGGPAIADGTYKVTLYGKDTGGAIDIYNAKAKSKVFKVECEPTVPTEVTPAPVSSVDDCGTAKDTYTIPATPGVKYQINGSTVLAGTYPGAGSVTVTAVADLGFVLTGTKSWTLTFTNIPCVVPPTVVTPSEPTKVDITCLKAGSYTIPATTGVVYKVNGVTTAAGTYEVTTAGKVTVTATPLDATYTLSGTTSWELTFVAPRDCPQPPVDVCPNITGVQTAVPVGLGVDDEGNCVEAGGRGGDEPTPEPITIITAAAQKTTPVTSVSTVNGEQLVNTGTSLVMNLFMALFLLGALAAVTTVSRQTSN